MEFKNRQSTNPGRVTLQNVSNPQDTKTYDIIMADGPSVEGTPLNANTFEQLKEDIIDAISPLSVKGDKGDKGDKGEGATMGTYITGITVTRIS